MRFDQAPLDLVRICEGFSGFETVERACLVRDVLGRVRLVLNRADARLDRASLEVALTAALGGYFVRPVYFTDRDDGSSDERRLAQKLLEISDDWIPVPAWSDPATGEERHAPAGRWRKFERRVSKHSWLEDARTSAPWPLDADKPAVVTFYSFKGGIGRTTALVACAWQLARQGKKVVVVDLDLEAPGVGALLNPASPSRGVIDFLVDFMVSADRNLDGLLFPATALGAEQENVLLAPAGGLGVGYLEKLARLDYFEDSSSGRGNPMPVQRALEALLHAILANQTFRPDYIFIDSRAGLHDLAGLSLHGLAHVDVLLGRASEQGYQGIDLTLQVLGARKRQELLSVIVHTFAPPERGSPVETAELAAFRARIYQSFVQYVYDDGDVPAEAADDKPHAPCIIHESSALRSFVSLRGVEQELFSQDYQGLCRRIVELCMPEEQA